MVQSVTLEDLTSFLVDILNVYDSYIFYTFVLMIFFNLAVFTKYIISGSR